MCMPAECPCLQKRRGLDVWSAVSLLGYTGARERTNRELSTLLCLSRQSFFLAALLSILSHPDDFVHGRLGE
jgi:hypothetical protein